MTSAQVVDNSPIQGYAHLDDHIPLTFIFKGINLLGNNLVLQNFSQANLSRLALN